MSFRNLVYAAVLAAVTIMFWRVAPLVAGRDTIERRYGELVEVEAAVRKYYVEHVDEKRLVDGAIRGVFDTLDRYSGYMTGKELAAYRNRLAGLHVGAGLEVGLVDGQATVIAPLAGGPAEAAGVKAGDHLLAIDGQPTETMSIGRIEEALAGPPDSTVELTLAQKGAAKRTVRVTRETVTSRTVRPYSATVGHENWMLDDEHGIGYVRITAFRQNTADQLDVALASLRADGMKALVLDLRSNPGGLVPAAVAVVDHFVADGMIVSTRTRQGASTQHYAKRSGTDLTTRLAVLIDASSASAAEIVAGSLQDHKRAVILGHRSFGKGCVQYVLALRHGEEAVRITSAYYQLPGGRIIHRTPENEATHSWGVAPDVKVTEEESSNGEPADAALDVAVRMLREPMADKPRMNDTP
jgi:carboxyl-terminal processing protease